MILLKALFQPLNAVHRNLAASTLLAKPLGSSFGFIGVPFGAKSQHNMAKPKLIVFDLDYTLWPFWVDTHVAPPFQMKSDGKVYDRRGQHVKYYRDVPEILSKLHSEGYKLGLASRTSAIEDGEALVKLFDWDKYFQFREIYPGCKKTHFERHHKSSGIPYKDMLFFDDEHRNIVEVSTLGVTCMFIPDKGVTHESLREGLELFKKNNHESGHTSS